jgi:hypothetical protein
VDVSTSKGRRENESVFAVKAGTVTLVGANAPAGSPAASGLTGYGNSVVVRSGDGATYMLYAHLKDGSVAVRPGQVIEGGTFLGLMGSTSNGLFSPLPGQSVEDWTRQARSRGYGAPVMNRHTHLEVRRARPDGSSPFPGVYPSDEAHAGQNIDPMPFLRDLGLRYSTRGAATIVPGSPIDRSRASWSQSMAGTLAVMGLDGDELDALGQETGYQPPEPERDAKWGISKTERLMLVTGGIVLTGTIAAFIIRSRMRPNRRRSGPRKNRLRSWGAK